MEQGILLLLMSLMVFVWALTTDFQHDRIEEKEEKKMVIGMVVVGQLLGSMLAVQMYRLNGHHKLQNGIGCHRVG